MWKHLSLPGRRVVNYHPFPVSRGLHGMTTQTGEALLAPQGNLLASTCRGSRLVPAQFQRHIKESAA